jgi:hypothetical protein
MTFNEELERERYFSNEDNAPQQVGIDYNDEVIEDEDSWNEENEDFQCMMWECQCGNTHADEDDAWECCVPDAQDYDCYSYHSKN